MTEFGYQTITKADATEAVTSVIAYEIQVTRPLRAVLWSAPRQAWIYAPAVAGAYLYDPDYQDRSLPIDRGTAEEIALLILPTPLPSEETLTAMFEEGEKNGWDWGPPENRTTAPAN